MLPPLVIVAFLIATTSGVNASVLVSVTQPARSQRLRARDVIAAGTGHLVFSHGRLILLGSPPSLYARSNTSEWLFGFV